MSSPIRRIDDGDQPFDRAPPWLSARRNIPEPERQANIVGPTFSGDRALVGLNRQLSRTADLIPEPSLALEAAEGGPENQSSMMWRFFSMVGIAAAIAWGIVLLPTLMKPTTETSQTDIRQAPNEAGPVRLADAAPTTVDPPNAENGSPTVNQPRMVALIPISKPPAASVPNESASAPPAAPVAKSVAAATSPPTTPLPQMSLSTAAAATPVAATSSSSPQSDPVTANPALAATFPSPQSSPDRAAQAGTASPVPASPQPQAQPAPASPQRVAPPTPSTAPPAVPVPASTAPDSADITMLLSRGKNFLASGDLSSAQLLFRRAAEAGSAEAAMNLASTYDPHYLADHHVVGVIGDEEKARAWYQRAIDLGSAEASHRLAELGN
jgi:hypothetical protein